MCQLFKPFAISDFWKVRPTFLYYQNSRRYFENFIGPMVTVSSLHHENFISSMMARQFESERTFIVFPSFNIHFLCSKNIH